MEKRNKLWQRGVKRKLDQSTAEHIREMVATGTPQKVFAIEYKLSKGTVSKIVNKTRYNQW